MDVSTPPPASPIHIPWGKSDTLEIRLPTHWRSTIANPSLQAPIPDYAATLQAALDNPINSPPLQKLASQSAKIAIVVDDPSRWTPLCQALPVVTRHLANLGINPTQIQICVGVGRHHALDQPALRAHLGAEIVDQYTCFSPPLDDATQYDSLGTAPGGLPVRVFRPVAQADLRILIGSVLPHLQAGFGGGYKLIFPGCCHRETLGALHRQGFAENRQDAAKLLGGNLEQNPMRKAIREAAALLRGPCFSISHLLGSPGQVLHLAAGDVDAVQLDLAQHARQRFEAKPSAPAEIAIVGNHPWPGDPLMSFKTLLNHRAACKPAGTLIGLFWTNPHELDRSLPLNILRTIAATGKPGGFLIRHGLKTAESLLSATKHPARFMLTWARELVADRHVLVFAPELKQRVGRQLGPVRLFDNLDPLWSHAASLQTVPHPHARVFPFGGLTYVTNPCNP